MSVLVVIQLLLDKLIMINNSIGPSLYQPLSRLINSVYLFVFITLSPASAMAKALAIC